MYAPVKKDRTMIVGKCPILFLTVWLFAVMACAPSVTPTTLTVQPEPTVASVQQEPTATAFIGMPEISNPLIQSDDESIEELVARIAARDISYSRPVLIAFTQVESKELLSLGISSDRWDVQECWFYEVASNRACTDEDLNNYFPDHNTPKIFFAFAYSDSVESLFLVRHFYYWGENYPNDYLRLFLELKDGKWIEKSILPYFW